MPFLNRCKRGDGSHITPAHSHNHCGNSSIGRSFHAQHATKQMSARLSSNAPVLVTHFSFRANHPSAMSLMPQTM